MPLSSPHALCLPTSLSSVWQTRGVLLRARVISPQAKWWRVRKRVTRGKPEPAIHSHLREAPPTRAAPPPPGGLGRPGPSAPPAPAQARRDLWPRWAPFLGHPEATPLQKRTEANGDCSPSGRPTTSTSTPTPAGGKTPPQLLARVWGRERQARSRCAFSPRR